MNILALDLGAQLGLVVYNTDSQRVSFNATYSVSNVAEAGELLGPLMRKLTFDVIVSSYPTRFYNTIVSHAKQMGVLEFISYQLNKTVIYTNDSTAKKAVFGKGKMSNEDIEYIFSSQGYHLDTPHEFDALMFAKWFAASN